MESLRNPGDRVLHASALTNAPVTLGNTIKRGSTFHNGKVTRELKGVSVVDGAPCAIVGYDSGECTLKMIIALDKDLEGLMEGGSQYKGDMYIDSGWARKTTLDEFVITHAGTTDVTKPRIYGYTVRHILLHLMELKEFEKPVVLLQP